MGLTYWSDYQNILNIQMKRTDSKSDPEKRNRKVNNERVKQDLQYGDSAQRHKKVPVGTIFGLMLLSCAVSAYHASRHVYLPDIGYP